MDDRTETLDARYPSGACAHADAADGPMMDEYRGVLLCQDCLAEEQRLAEGGA